jgi:hypothetical protein
MADFKLERCHFRQGMALLQRTADE